MSDNTLFPMDFTPTAWCATPYNPSVHDAQKKALASKIRNELVQYGIFEMTLAGETLSRGYLVHVLKPIVRELNALGWVARIDLKPVTFTICDAVHSCFEHIFIVNAV